MVRPMPRCKNRIQSNVRNINNKGHAASGGRRSIVSKNKKTIKQTHFPVNRLLTVNYRDFSAFGLRELPSFLSAAPAPPANVHICRKTSPGRCGHKAGTICLQGDSVCCPFPKFVKKGTCHKGRMLLYMQAGQRPLKLAMGVQHTGLDN